MIDIIKSLFNETVYTIIDYDKKHYLAEVGTEEGTEMYAINKKTMEVTSYSVGMDTVAFFDALHKRTIYRHDGLKNVMDIPEDVELYFRLSTLYSDEVDKKKTTPTKQWFDNLREAYKAKEEKEQKYKVYTRLGKILVVFCTIILTLATTALLMEIMGVVKIK